MAYFFPSVSGLLLQATGALLMASLCLLLLRTVHRRPLVFWSMGWTALFVSLTGLWLSLGEPSESEWARHAGQATYLLGEYAFGYLVYVGCRSYARGVEPARKEAWLLLPAAAIALGLPWVAGHSDNVFFAIHSLIFPYLFFAARRVLRGIPAVRQRVAGLTVLKGALLLLTIDYLHYAPLFAASYLQDQTVLVVAYLAYAPLYDLIFQIMLMFGMVMAVTGQVQHELETANTDLAFARDRLEAMARVDPLTSALNRRAYAAVVEDLRRGGTTLHRGTVAVVDLDDLKAINDRFGHAAGDVALQALAGGLRACMEPDDLLFRWGGDEFVVLFAGATEAVVQGRVGRLNGGLLSTQLPGADRPFELSASVGLAAFDEAVPLDTAIASADQAMYRRKRAE